MLKLKRIPASLIATCLLSFSLTAHAQATLKPVLPLSYSSTELPLVDAGLRDPGMGQNMAQEDYGYEQLMQEIAELESDLKLARKERREEVLRSLYTNHAAKAYYCEDALTGRIRSGYSKEKLRQSLATSQKAVARYATEYAKVTKNKQEKSRALYHVIATRMAGAGKKDVMLKQLGSLAKNLPESLQIRIQMLTALKDIERTPSVANERKVAQLIKHQTSTGKVAARLAIAKSKARRGDKTYRPELFAATKASAHLKPEQKAAVLSYSLAVWRSAGKNEAWNKTPIYLKSFQDTPAFSAVIERNALADLASGNLNSAIKKYHTLSDKMIDDQLMIALDRRTLDLELMRFKKDKNIGSYERSLIAFTTKYNGTNTIQNEKLGASARSEFRSRHKMFVNTVIASAKQKSSQKSFRTQSIGVIRRYQELIGKGPEERQLSATIAQLYTLNGQHAQAVDTYETLVSETQGEEAQKYMRLAIESQKILAQWPNQAPWTGIKTGHKEARTKLAQLYSQLLTARKNPHDWSVISHLGLLHLHAGETSKAFAMWRGALEKGVVGSDGRQAAGYMLVVYTEAKSWDDVEKTADLCLQQKIQPMRGTKSLSAQTFLADALFIGGKEAYAAKDFKNSVRRLKRFSETFKKESRRHESMFVLAHAYRGNAQHVDAVKTLMAQAEEYPNSSFNRQALLTGGEWSTPMALEEEAIFFHSRFLKRYEKEPKALEIRQVLANLYMGRELYGNAARIHKEQVLDKRSNNSQKVASALRYMEIEERYGDVRNAKWGALQIKKLGKKDKQALAQAYGFEARYGAKNDYKWLKALEKEIASMNTTDGAVGENLAMVRLMMADIASARTKNEIFNLGVKDPMATLNQHYSYFQQSKKDYESVCSVGETAYCAPAMSRLARITQNTIRSIEDLTIQDTLEANIVVKFNERKQNIIGTLADIAQSADYQSLAVVSEGSTEPTTAQEVVWTNSADWDFDQVSESGNGFLQWQTSREAAQ